LKEAKMTDMDYMLKELNRIANALERIADACGKSFTQSVGKADLAAKSCSKNLSTQEII